MKAKRILSLALALALSSMTAVMASAAQAPADGCGYLSGQQKSSERHAQYEQAKAVSTDAGRSAFFAANGIGGGAHSDALHLDVDALTAAGILDQQVADNIRQYAASKHAELSERYSGTSDMTPEERHTYYAGFGRSGGDSVDTLRAAGIITQEQAEAINAYLAG